MVKAQVEHRRYLQKVPFYLSRDSLMIKLVLIQREIDYTF
jgi:hypothetical protein